MSKSKLSRCIPVLVEHPIGKFLKNARKAYRQVFPEETKQPGRRSEEKEVLKALKSILLSAEETSVRKWSQERWASRINKLTNISPRTIHRHFKEILRRNLLPLHMIPASFVRTLPVEQQRLHWLAVAWGGSIECASVGSTIGPIAYKDVLDRHQKLMAKHMARRPA